MSETIEGIFRDGKIELIKQPKHVQNARVLVTFIDGTSSTPSRPPSEEERAQAIEDLIHQMKESQVTGGRGYLFREEIYAERLNRYWKRKDDAGH